MSEEIKSPYTRYATENDLEKILSHIKTYNNLELIGLSNDDMSATDFLTNIKTINTALGDGDSILYLTTTNADNLHLSAVDKLNADTGKELGYTMVEGDKGKFVAVSEDNDILYSEDGINWELSTISIPSQSRLVSVTYGNGKFVAVSGDGTTAIYSEDGINWIETKLPDFPYNKYLSSVTYGNGKFVAMSGYFSSHAAYSEDGINWVETTLPMSNTWSSVTYGNGKFVAVPIGHYMDQAIYSEDGITWTLTSMPATDRGWRQVIYGDNKFVAIMDYNNIIAYSEDGINWVLIVLPDDESPKSITYGNGRFIITTYANGSGVVYYSDNGINWEVSLGSIPGWERSWYTSVYGNDKFIAITNGEMSYSEDGIAWEPNPISIPMSGWNLSITYGIPFVKQYTSSPLSLKISRTGDIHNTVTIEAIYNADNESKYIYSCNYYNDTISNFTNEEITTIKQIDKTLSSLTQSKTIFEPLPIQVATAEGQTQFTVNYDTFDAENDTLLVQSGITMLYPNVDFTVSGNTVTLTEGVPLGRTIGMYIMKIVQIPMSNNIISYGTVDLEPGVTPLAEGHIHFVYEQG